LRTLLEERGASLRQGEAERSLPRVLGVLLVVMMRPRLGGVMKGVLGVVEMGVMGMLRFLVLRGVVASFFFWRVCFPFLYGLTKGGGDSESVSRVISGEGKRGSIMGANASKKNASGTSIGKRTTKTEERMKRQRRW
jgi:hypothetical protein